MRNAVSTQIALVLLGRFVSDLGRGFTSPFSAVYFHDEVGLSAKVIGAGRLAAGCAALGAVFWGGYLSDRFGRKKCLTLALLGSGVVQPFFPWARGPGSFLALSLLSGALIALYWPVCGAILTDLSPPAQRGRVFTLLRIAVNAGIGLGMLGAGYVVESLTRIYGQARWGYHALFYIDGGTYIVFAIILWFCVRETLPTDAAAAYRGFRAGWGEAFRDGTLRALVAVNVGFTLCYALFDPGFPLFYTEYVGLRPKQVGGVLAMNTALCVLAQIPVWWLVDRWARTRVLAAAAVAMGSGLLILHLAPADQHAGFVVVIVSMLVFTVGELLHGPASTALFANAAPDHLRGTYMSAQSASWAVGIGIGPMIAGAFFDAGSPGGLWNTLVTILALTAVFLLALGRRLPAEVDAPQRRGTARSSVLPEP